MAALLACAIPIATAGVANATTTLSFAVNTTADSHDANPGDGSCADGNGLCSLRGAVEEANAQPTGTIVTVSVPAGTYKLTLGTLAVAHDPITATGAGASTTVVRHSGAGAVVSVAAGSNAGFVGLELTGGKPATTDGGGLHNSGTTKLTKVMITANSARTGAGIANAAKAVLTLNTTTVSANSVATVPDSHPGGSGGGILNAGKLTLSRSTLSGNYAGEGGFGAADTGGVGGSGGGIANTGTVIATNSTITGNYAGNGGPGEQEIPGGGGNGGGI